MHCKQSLLVSLIDKELCSLPANPSWNQPEELMNRNELQPKSAICLKLFVTMKDDDEDCQCCPKRPRSGTLDGAEEWHLAKIPRPR